jgi:hypothetical protein
MHRLTLGFGVGRSARSTFLLMGLLILAIALVACGGGDDEDSGDTATSTNTPAAGGATSQGTAAASATATTAGSGGDSASSAGTADGNKVAHDAMIQASDLPGTGWSETSTDEFTGSILDVDESDLGNTPACNTYVEKLRKAAQAAEAARIGRASKSFEKSDALLGASIDVEVGVYKNSDVVNSFVSEAKSALGSNAFDNCFRDAIKSSEGDVPEEVLFNLKTVNPSTGAPHNGVAKAFDLELSAAGQKFSLHAELYAWADNKATAFVSIFGTPDSINADLVKAAVNKTASKVGDAQ